MAIKLSQLTAASALSKDDLLLVTQDISGTDTSASGTVYQAVAAGHIDVENITVQSNAWTPQTPPDFAGFPYVATITINGVTSDDIAEVIPSISAISGGKLCPLNKTVTNGVQIYASEALSSAITIERVSLRGSV